MNCRKPHRFTCLKIRNKSIKIKRNEKYYKKKKKQIKTVSATPFR